MKYRAMVVGVLREGHQVQIFAQHWDAIKEQALGLANQYQAPVEVFQTSETLVLLVAPVAAEKAAPAA